MKKVYTHENRMIVFNMKNVLQGEGIETVLVYDYDAGGAGDLPTFDTWPELWIEDESKLAQAQAIVEDILAGAEKDAWFCSKCHEQNDAMFRICWNCGQACE
jgi:hypothetical protein